MKKYAVFSESFELTRIGDRRPLECHFFTGGDIANAIQHERMNGHGGAETVGRFDTLEEARAALDNARGDGFGRFERGYSVPLYYDTSAWIELVDEGTDGYDEVIDDCVDSFDSACPITWQNIEQAILHANCSEPHVLRRIRGMLLAGVDGVGELSYHYDDEIIAEMVESFNKWHPDHRI